MAIPVVPTVRVVVTFTKFVELQSTEQFFTPLSSPRHFVKGSSEDDQKSDTHYSPFLSSSSSSSMMASTWLRRNSSQSASKQQQQQQQRNSSSSSSSSVGHQQLSDPFAIPIGYTLSSIDDKSSKMKRSKSSRKSK